MTFTKAIPHTRDRAVGGGLVVVAPRFEPDDLDDKCDSGLGGMGGDGGRLFDDLGACNGLLMTNELGRSCVSATAATASSRDGGFLPMSRPGVIPSSSTPSTMGDRSCKRDDGTNGDKSAGEARCFVGASERGLRGSGD